MTDPFTTPLDGFLTFGLGSSSNVPVIYKPPAPTGWKSVSERKGPDPSGSAAIRKAGEG